MYLCVHDMLIVVASTVACTNKIIDGSSPACIYLSVEIVIGFSAGSVSIASDEALNGTVTLSIRILNGTINEGTTVPIRVTTANNSADGNLKHTYW